MPEVTIVKKSRPCEDWETFYEAVTLAGMMLTTSRDHRTKTVSSFTTRLIDPQNAEEVAAKLGVQGKTVSELSAAFRNMGALIETQQPQPGFRANFIKEYFRPCH